VSDANPRQTPAGNAVRPLEAIGRTLLGLRAADRPLGRGAQAAVAAAYLALAPLAAAWLYDFWNQPLLLDNQHYFYVAERAASGVPPHISNFDPKHHASSLLAAIGVTVGRPLGLDDVRATRVVSLLIYGAGMAATWLAALAMTRSPLSAHAAAAAMWSFAMFSWHASMGSQPKVYLALFMLAALWTLARGRPTWCGVFGALAYLCWQPGVVVFGAAGLAFLIPPGRVRNVLRLAAGALLTLVVYETYFFAHGWNTVREQWFQTFVFPAEYMRHQSGGFRGLMPAGEILWRAWRASFGASTFVAIAALVLLLLSLLAMPFAPRRAVRFVRERPVWLGWGLCTAVSVGFTYYDHQGPPDLFFMLPFLAIGLAGALAAVAAATVRVNATFGRFVACAIGVAAFAWGVHAGLRGAQRLHRSDVNAGYDLDDQYALSGRVAKLRKAGQTVFAVRCTHLMGMAHLENHVNYGLMFPGLQDYLTQRGTRDFDPQRAGQWPDVVLAARLNPQSAFVQWLRRNYRVRRAPEFERQHIAFYERPGRLR